MDIVTLSLFLVNLFVHLLAVLGQSTTPISSSITVVGAVYCDTCLNNGFSKHSYFIPGVDVHIQCKINANSPKTAETIAFSVNRTTDRYGVYKLRIPSVDGVDCVDGPPIQSFCQATLIGSSSSVCDKPTLKVTTTEISVKSKQDNLCIYSFTPLSFRPSKRNNTLCGKEDEDSRESGSSITFSWPNLPTSSILQAFGPLPFIKPTSLPFPFSSPPPNLPFPFPHQPSNPSIPPLFHSPPPPSFNLGDPTTWIPHIPLMSPPPPPPPAFNLGDPRTWRPIFPPANP